MDKIKRLIGMALIGFTLATGCIKQQIKDKYNELKPVVAKQVEKVNNEFDKLNNKIVQKIDKENITDTEKNILSEIIKIKKENKNDFELLKNTKDKNKIIKIAGRIESRFNKLIKYMDNLSKNDLKKLGPYIGEKDFSLDDIKKIIQSMKLMTQEAKSIDNIDLTKKDDFKEILNLLR